MVSRITSKSDKALENQVDKKAAKAKSADQQLFDQFSELLDKIATTVDRAKGRERGQSISELANSFGQAVAQQVSQRPVVERKAEPKSKPAEASVERPAPENRPELPAVAQQNVDAPKKEGRPETGAEKPAKDEKQATPEAEQKPAEQGCATVDPKLAADYESKNTGSSVPVEQTVVEVPAEVAADVETIAAAVNTGEEVPVEAEVEVDAEVEAEVVATKPVESAHVAVAEEVGVEELPQVEAAPELKAAANAQAPVETEAEVPTETAATAEPETTEIPVDTSAADIEKNRQINAKMAENKQIDNQTILMQSAQQLIAQAMMMSPSKQMRELGATSAKMFSANNIQGVNQAGNTSNGFGSPVSQLKLSQSPQERSSAKELSRPAALRTMERVESALKEVARSKDGKTISLRLDPPSLGSVKIDVTLKDGQLHARFVAESPQVSTLLREQSHELQQMLRKAGITAEKVTVSIAGEPQLDLNQSFSTFDQQAPQQFRESSRSGGAITGGTEIQGSGANVASSTPQALDHWVA